ncbi:MAG: hypothetical protein FJ243_00490, partial [Nitrospira sp.]|nr:hypothetical protein [Nitrospira sp.]
MKHTEQMESFESLIDELSELCGILPEYFDIFGNKHTTSLETKKAILKSMNLNIEYPSEIRQEIDTRKWRTWRSLIEPVYVFSQKEQPISIPVYIPVNEGEEKRLTLRWSLEDERGTRNEFVVSSGVMIIADHQWINGRRYIKIHLQDNEIRDIGYYVIHVSCTHPEYIFPEETNTLEKTSRVIITPDSCYLPSELQTGRGWGISINLYAINSRRNWGVGDFTDLRKIVRWIANLK